MAELSIEIKRPLGFIALDIETTGKYFIRKDRCFAIGWAYGSIDDAKDGIVTGNACLAMSKPSDMAWGDFWRREGFEQSCYDGFWRNHLSILDKLQDMSKVNLFSSEEEMIKQLENVLSLVERLFDKVVIVTDTTCYDTVWLSYLLAKHGLESLLYKRNGDYNDGGAIEVDSYKCGVYHVAPCQGELSPWLDDPIYVANLWPCHDHHPENDARHILSTLFASMARKSVK